MTLSTQAFPGQVGGFDELMNLDEIEMKRKSFTIKKNKRQGFHVDNERPVSHMVLQKSEHKIHPGKEELYNTQKVKHV